jgi:hypothetical protein
MSCGKSKTVAANDLEVLARLRAALRTETCANDLEGLFAVINEDFLDALESIDDDYLYDYLNGARRELRRSYAVLAAQEPAAEDTPAFILGRITGLLELVGAAADRQEASRR